MPTDLARPLNEFYTQTFEEDVIVFTCHTCAHSVGFGLASSELNIFIDLIGHLREAHNVAGTLAPWQEG